MLLVFRQHRLASSATGGASATLPALVQAPARLRANVPSYRLRAASYVLRHGVVGSRGETPSLPFLCRRFFSQTEKKCRNAGSVKSLIIVGREGSKPIINNLQLL